MEVAHVGVVIDRMAQCPIHHRFNEKVSVVEVIIPATGVCGTVTPNSNWSLESMIPSLLRIHPFIIAGQFTSLTRLPSTGL